MSGLFLTSIKIITLAVGNQASDVPIIVYFSLTIAFNTIDMFLNLAFCRSKIYQDKIVLYLRKSLANSVIVSQEDPYSLFSGSDSMKNKLLPKTEQDFIAENI